MSNFLTYFCKSKKDVRWLPVWIIFVNEHVKIGKVKYLRQKRHLSVALVVIYGVIYEIRERDAVQNRDPRARSVEHVSADLNVFFVRIFKFQRSAAVYFRHLTRNHDRVVISTARDVSKSTSYPQNFASSEFDLCASL